MKKDSSWKRTKYSKGVIKERKSKGVFLRDTLYKARAFLEINESYYPDGTIKSIWYNKRKNKSEKFQIWSMDSVNMNFYSNGQLADSLNWKNNMRIGEAKHYYENGQLAYTVNYKDGRLNNVLNYFLRDGTEAEIGSLMNGKGDWYQYNEEGKLINVAVYKNGRLKKIIDYLHYID